MGTFIIFFKNHFSEKIGYIRVYRKRVNPLSKNIKLLNFNFTKIGIKMTKIIFLILICSFHSFAQSQNGISIIGNLGVGTNTPREKLEILGNIHLRGILKFDEDGAIANSHINTYETNIVGGGASIYSRYFFGHYGDLIIQGINTPYAGNIHFVTNSTVGSTPTMRMIVMNTGNIGIGNFAPYTNPLARLHIQDGDIYLQNPSTGVIMKSPNGQCWRLSVSNTGQSLFSLIACPN